LSCGCSKAVWRPGDSTFDDHYTDASVKPSPSTVNTHTQPVVYTLNIKNIQAKCYFRKNPSLKDFCLYDFAEMYKWSYFLPMTVTLYHHAGCTGK